MRCETCHGAGMVEATVESAEGPVRCPYLGEPCPDCGGTGIAHCCDGNQPSDREAEIEKTRNRRSIL